MSGQPPGAVAVAAPEPLALVSEDTARTSNARAVWLLIAGQGSSTIGDGCYAVALPWYVLANDGGASALGAVLAAYGIARAAAMPIGGVLCDRFGARRVLLVVDVVRAALLGGFALIAAVGMPSLVLVAAVSALIGACQGAFVPGSFALMPSIAREEDLQRANAGLTGALQAGSLIGPVIGAALVAGVGPAWAFALDAVTFGISAGTLAVLRLDAAVRSENDGEAPTLRAIVAAHPVLPIMLVVVLAGNLASGGIFSVALPVLAHDQLGASGYGAVLAALAAGAVGGTALAAGIRARRPAVLATQVFLAQTVALAVLPYLGGIGGAVIAALAFGLANAVGELLIVTAIQRSFPSAALGRIMGLLMLASTGAFPVSVVLVTAVVGYAGAAAAFPLAGAFTAAALLFGLSRETFRQFAAVTA